jgi:hypothetical protein
MSIPQSTVENFGITNPYYHGGPHSGQASVGPMIIPPPGAYPGGAIMMPSGPRGGDRARETPDRGRA